MGQIYLWRYIMSTSNITNYKSKDFAQLFGVSVKNTTAMGQRRNSKN